MATIWKRKDRDCWAVDYRDATGKRIRLTVSTRQDAETLLAEKINEIKEQDPTALSLRDMTLKEYAERWSERVKGEIEEKTWRSYKQNLDCHVVPTLGHLKVREITVSHVARFLADKRKARYGTGEGKPYSGANLSEPYWLFPGRDGGLASEGDERWHRDLFKQVLSAAKLPGFVPYDLRHTFASLLLSSNVPLLYVSKQLGHAKPTTTLDHYAKWLPSGEQRFVNVLDTQLEKVGTNSWHQVDITVEKEAEAVEEFGGPCRGRTYGPLIKSQLLYQLS